MSPRIKFGLIAGLIGGLFTFCGSSIAPLLGFCGPFIGLIAGAAAGLLTARNDPQLDKTSNAKAGAVAGLVAGGLMFIAPIVGSLISLVVSQLMATNTAGGLPNIPTFSDDPALIAVFYASGIGFGVCAGIFNVIASALAGAAAGYLNPAPTSPATPSY